MIFYYFWPDKTVSLVEASNAEEAQFILDEIGDANIKGIKKYSSNKHNRSFHITFKSNPDKIHDNDDEEPFLFDNSYFSLSLFNFLDDNKDKLKY